MQMILIKDPIVNDIYKDSNKNTIYHWISDLPTILVEINTVVKQIAIKPEVILMTFHTN